MPKTPDAIVIGSGPNGLVAACVLARAGLDVLVLETHPLRAGGAVGSEAATLPGFVHDVGAAFFPWGKLSPAFRDLPVADYGLQWCHAEFDSCHPALDGSVAAIARDADLTARHFGSAADGQAWKQLAKWYANAEARIIGALLGPLSLRSALPTLPLLPKLAPIFLASGATFARRTFDTEAARRVIPALALHVDVGPDDTFGAGLGFMLGMTATTGGFVVPKGGAGAITQALLDVFQTWGGRIELDARVSAIRVLDGEAHGVVVHGEVIEAKHAILADTDVGALWGGKLIDPEFIPSRILDRARHYPRGFSTFKVDWALSGPVPWTSEEARRSAVVHTGEDLADLARFTAQVRRGELPDRPYLVIGQQSIADPSRAPAGKHTLWAYSRVPTRPDGGWQHHAEAFADRIDQRIEGLAPGFRSTILARRIITPPDLQAMDENLVDGDLGGGSNAWHRQLVFRPVFPYFNYRTPVRRLYLCSSYAHPGPGVHGMCGYNAAHVALHDIS